MAVPVNFDEAYAWSGLIFLADVADIITKFRSLALNLSPAWTEPSTALFQSPVDADSRSFDVLLTRISATNLEVRVRTSGATAVDTGRVQIPAGGTLFSLDLGEHYYDLQCYTSAWGAEYSFGGIVDLTPESQTAWTTYYYADNYRSTADAIRGSRSADYAYAWNGSSYGSIQAFYSNLEYRNLTEGYISGITGARLYPHVWMQNNNKYAGRLYNHVWADSALQPGTRFTVPLDAGVNATFLALVPAASASACRKAVRIG